MIFKLFKVNDNQESSDDYIDQWKHVVLLLTVEFHSCFVVSS